MRLFLEFISLVILVYAFKAVRQHRILMEIKSASKMKSIRSALRESEAWLKISTRDTRPDRDRYVYDAPTYTSYTTEQTGKVKTINQPKV